MGAHHGGITDRSINTLAFLVNETMLRRVATGLVLVLLLALPATAQDFQKGLAVYKRGDYATALKEWRPLAVKGDARAQYKLGNMYKNGEGVSEDDAKAVKWYRKAAEQGHVRAQYDLGRSIAGGQGTLLNGIEAAKWFRKAAEQGHAMAQYRLGLRYSMGTGVPKNNVRAYMWWSLAAMNGIENGALFRDRVAELMTPAQIAEAQKLAREWLEKHKKKRIR